MEFTHIDSLDAMKPLRRPSFKLRNVAKQGRFPLRERMGTGLGSLQTRQEVRNRG